MTLDDAQLAMCEAAIALTKDGKVLRQCSQALGVGRSTLEDWLGSSPQLAGRYAQAREAFAHAFAEDLVIMSQDKTLDAKHRRVAFDCGMKVLSRWFPDKYGEAILLKHEDVTPREALSHAQIVERLATMLKRPTPLQLSHDIIDAEYTVAE